MRIVRGPLLLIPCIAASCTNLGPNPYVQPQAVYGPCTVQPFFIVRLSQTPTEMKVENNGRACVISMFNPDLGVAQDAAFVPVRPAHGQVLTQIYGGERGIAVVSYAPTAGYAGLDSFEVTFEPQARDVLFHVTVTPPGAPAG